MSQQTIKDDEPVDAIQNEHQMALLLTDWFESKRRILLQILEMPEDIKITGTVAGVERELVGSERDAFKCAVGFALGVFDELPFAIQPATDVESDSDEADA